MLRVAWLMCLHCIPELSSTAQPSTSESEEGEAAPSYVPLTRLCPTNRCLHGGQCIIVGATTQCICQQSYTGPYCEEELGFQYSTLSATCRLYMELTCVSKPLGNALLVYSVVSSVLLVISFTLLYLSCRNPYWLDELQSSLGVKLTSPCKDEDSKQLGYSDDEDLYQSDSEDCINLTPPPDYNYCYSY